METAPRPSRSHLDASAFQDDLRNGVLFGVRKRKRNMDGAEFGRELRSLAVECDGGTASRLAAHFNVAPGDPMIPSGADGFHCGFFGSETRGVALHPVGLRFAVVDLGLGKDPAQKTVTEACDRRFDARDFRYVDASAYDHSDSQIVFESA